MSQQTQLQQASRPALPVLLTVDTELWPTMDHWPTRKLGPDKRSFAAEVAADVHGLSSRGAYGLPYQLGVLRQHGLKASYFVEALCATRVGRDTLAHIVGLVQAGGQQVQLHLHTEWLSELDQAGLPQLACQYLCQLPLAQQTALIRHGLDNLRQAGVEQVLAFRAGSYGGNLDTLRALAGCGVHIDSSHNASHLVGDWDGRRIVQPQWLEGVWECPVSCFQDWPGHYRHAQLCAISYAEMRNALLTAWREQWPLFVIVLHSFELVHRQGPPRLPTPNRLALRRFDQLCGFLSRHREQFSTLHFSDLAPPAPTLAVPARPLPPPFPNVPSTLWRMAEQVWGNVH